MDLAELGLQLDSILNAFSTLNDFVIQIPPVSSRHSPESPCSTAWVSYHLPSPKAKAVATAAAAGSSTRKLGKVVERFGGGSGKVRHAESLGRNDTVSSNEIPAEQYFRHAPSCENSKRWST